MLEVLMAIGIGLAIGLALLFVNAVIEALVARDGEAKENPSLIREDASPDLVEEFYIGTPPSSTLSYFVRRIGEPRGVLPKDRYGYFYTPSSEVGSPRLDSFYEE